MGRGLSANTPHFAGAFASLLLCVLMLYGLRVQGEASFQTRWAERENPSRDEHARLAVRLEKTLSAPLVAPPERARPTAPQRSLATARMETEPGIELAHRLDPGPIRERLLAMALAPTAANATESARTPAANPPAPQAVGPTRMRASSNVRPSKVSPDSPSKGNDLKTDLLPPGTLREYAYQLPLAEVGPGELAQTIAWYPALFSADGTAQIAFDLPREAATYRILATGHSRSARLGVTQGRLEARPAPR